jgi:hypothetical protein
MGILGDLTSIKGRYNFKAMILMNYGFPVTAYYIKALEALWDDKNNYFPDRLPELIKKMQEIKDIL